VSCRAFLGAARSDITARLTRHTRGATPMLVILALVGLMLAIAYTMFQNADHC
jgi:hypothetical protein